MPLCPLGFPEEGTGKTASAESGEKQKGEAILSHMTMSKTPRWLGKTGTGYILTYGICTQESNQSSTNHFPS